MFPSFKTPLLYVIVALVAALGATGWMLKNAWQGEAEANAVNDQWRTAYEAQQRGIENVQAEYRDAQNRVIQMQEDRQAQDRQSEILTQRLREALANDHEYQNCRDIRLNPNALDAFDGLLESPAAGLAEH